MSSSEALRITCAGNHPSPHRALLPFMPIPVLGLGLGFTPLSSPFSSFRPHRQLEHGATTAMTPTRNMVAKDREEMETGSVFIYIDNSNLWIQGQRTYAEKHKQDADRDPRWRFDAGILKDILLKESGLSPHEATFEPRIRLYGSRPPVVDSVWKAIELHDIKVRTFLRSSWTRREKEVDAELIADSVEEASEAYYNTIPAVFIIVSGDRDLHAAVVKIAKRGFPVHIWSWKNGIANSFTKEDKDIDPRLFRVHYLDPYLETVGFSQTTFRVDRGVINPHSIVVLDPMSRVKAVEDFFSHLRTPIWRYLIPGQREDESNDLAIIPCLAHELKPDELRSLFIESKTKLERKGLRVLSYQEYAQKYFLGSGTESTLAISNQFSELGNYVERDEDSGEEGSEEETVGKDDYDEKKANHEEDNGNNDHRKQDAAGLNLRRDDNDNEGFEEVNKGLKKQQTRLRKANDSLQFRCHWRAYCNRALNCTYGHTKEEEDNFRVYGNKKARKFKDCTREGCLYGTRCPYAHGLEELFCPTCEKTGAHKMELCPERSSTSNARVNYSR